MAAFRGRHGTLLVCELKADDVIDEFDMTGFRASYAAAFAKSIAAIRPGFTNVVAFATDMGILETLRSLIPVVPHRLPLPLQGRRCERIPPRPTQGQPVGMASL